MWVIEEGDYIVLGRFESVAVVGVYFFAFRISRHVMSILTFQMSRVLFPALSSLPVETGQQVSAFIRAARLIAAVCFPVCFAMSAVARPLVQLCFDAKWYDAIPLIQIMCLGMTIRTMSWPVASLFKAQGRFRMHLIISACSITVFFPVTILGTWLGSAIGLAIAVALFYSVFTLVEFALVLRPSGQVWPHLVSVFTAPIFAAIAATLAGSAAAYFVVPKLELGQTIQHLTQIILVLVIGAGVYIPLIRLLAPEVWRDAMLRGKRVLPSWLGNGA